MPHFSSLVFPFPQLRRSRFTEFPRKKRKSFIGPPFGWPEPGSRVRVGPGWRLIGLGVPRGKVPGAYRAGAGGAFKGQLFGYSRVRVSSGLGLRVRAGLGLGKPGQGFYGVNSGVPGWAWVREWQGFYSAVSVAPLVDNG